MENDIQLIEKKEHKCEECGKTITTSYIPTGIFSLDGVPERYKEFWGLLDHVKTRTLKNKDKGSYYDYSLAFFDKKLQQEKDEFLTAIKYQVHEDYIDKLADYVGYIVGWGLKMMEDDNDKSS